MSVCGAFHWPTAGFTSPVVIVFGVKLCSFERKNANVL